MPVAGDVNVSVFNVLGQNVTNLVDGHMEAGTHEVIWNGKDRDGATVASGIYFYRIDTDQYSETKKMMLLK
jgi:flagellar hook assembly protein FlgD